MGRGLFILSSHRVLLGLDFCRFSLRSIYLPDAKSFLRLLQIAIYFPDPMHRYDERHACRQPTFLGGKTVVLTGCEFRDGSNGFRFDLVNRVCNGG
jgi:hypothetical protein